MINAKTRAFRETVGISFDRFVKTEGFGAVGPGEAGMEHYALSTYRNREILYIGKRCWLGHGRSEREQKSDSRKKVKYFLFKNV